MYTIVESHIYTKMASAILTQDEQEALATFIAMQPESGDVIPHSGGCRKLRWQRQNMSVINLCKSKIRDDSGTLAETIKGGIGKMTIDLEKINIAEHEFTGEEIGELLLTSVRQIKSGQCHEREITNEAIAARKNTGLSQSAFAQLMGISVRTLQGWEQGRRKPTGAAATLLKIATHHPDVLLELAG